MKNHIFATLRSLTLALLFIAGVSYAWTGPTQTAPDGNVPAPVNVGGVSQTKAGPLWAGGVFSTQGGYFAGNIEIAGTGPANGFYFDGDDDTWLRLRTGNNGAYRDFAADDLYAANNVYVQGGITLGGVHRTTWPSGTTPSATVYACPNYADRNAGYYTCGHVHTCYGQLSTTKTTCTQSTGCWTSTTHTCPAVGHLVP